MPTAHLENRPSQLPAHHLESLGSARRQHLAGVVAGVAPDWSVELHYDEHGKAAIVIMPEDPDDTIAPTLIVSTTGSAFLLDELRYDAYRRLCESLSWADILRTVQIKLIWEGPFPTTRH
ncbi:MAG: hypothetical protein ABSG18_24030 [Steroidobacteraceae bacterium]|jgi:hypothetical protein